MGAGDKSVSCALDHTNLINQSINLVESINFPAPRPVMSPQALPASWCTRMVEQHE